MSFNLILYVIIGTATAFSGCLNSDEAAKYITPEQLFWLRTATTTLLGAAVTVKGVTSNAFSEWLAKRNGNGHTPKT